MAKLAVRKETTYCKVTPLVRSRLDPYKGNYVRLGDTFVVDSAKAAFLEELGEVEILEEGVTPPWSPGNKPIPVSALTPATPASKEK